MMVCMKTTLQDIVPLRAAALHSRARVSLTINGPGLFYTKALQADLTFLALIPKVTYFVRYVLACLYLGMSVC